MNLQNDPLTEVFINKNNGVSIKQPDEPCGDCGNTGQIIVCFSAQRARIIGKELMRLAREIESLSKEENHA